MNTRLVVTLLAVTSLTSTATPSLAAQDVGVAAAVNRQAQGTPPGRPTRTIILGNNIIFKERIETGGSGLVQVLLVDGSTFTVGANSDLVIDEFVYDPAAGTGKLVASFGKGVARFVGGKLSKGADGVNVRTPVGTIGIRGGIANMDVRGDGATFSLIYGKELTFAGRNGNRERVYEAGYTIAVGGNGQGSAVRRTTRADLGGIQNALGGRPGQNGGIPKPPTDTQVANSGIQSVNSGLGVVRAVPVPKPQVVRATELEQIEPRLLQVAQLDKLPDVKPDPKPTPTPDPTPEPEPTPEPGPGPRPDPTPTPDPVPDPNEPTKPEPTPTPTPEPTPTPNPTTQNVQARALFGSPGFYEVPGGSVIVSNPGAQGILGNNSATTQDATLTLQSNGNAAMSGGATTDGAILRGTANGEQMSVPVPTSSGMHYFQSAITSAGKHFGALAIDSVPVLPTIDASTQGTITHIGRGAYYRGVHNFFALAYQSADTPETTPTFEGDLGDIRFLFGGTPTSFSSMVVTSGTPKLRTYTLEGDMQQAIRFGEDEGGGTRRILSSKALFMNPVASDALGSDFMAGVRSGGLTVLDGTGSGATTRPLGLASSFLISGQGSAQKSLVSLFAGEVFDDTVSLKMQGQRRGSYRSSSVDSSGNFSGRIRSVAGTDGAQAFGNTAQNFILSADLGNEPYHDSFAVVPTGITPPKQVSSSMHIANLQSSVDSTGIVRTSRGISGYAAGVLQQPNGVGGLKATALATRHPMDMSVEFDAARKSVNAEMQLTETGYQDDPGSSTDQAMSMDISFGDESAAIEDPRRSVFIDDDRYAALESNSSYSTPTIEDNDGNTAYGTKATSYFLPSTMVANGDAGLFAAGQKCTCAFLEWGYWGTSVATPGASAGDPDVLNQVHLGTWAAGRILGPGAMPTTGTASYSGHAVGSVVNGGAQYLAAGDFSMSVDFAARTGNAAISNFDGRNFSSSLAAGSILDDKNQMTGLITDGATMTGSFGASLVEGPNSPVEGVVGGFSAFDGAWNATGVVVGQQP